MQSSPMKLCNFMHHNTSSLAGAEKPRDVGLCIACYLIKAHNVDVWSGGGG